MPAVVITAENFWFWFGGIWLAVGLLFLGVGAGIALNRSSEDARLASSGVETEGIVLVKERAERGGSASYHVQFRFPGPQGKPVHGSAELAPDAWNELVERGRISIVYLPLDPALHRVRGQTSDQAWLAVVFPLIGGTLAIVGALVIANARRTRRARYDSRHPRSQVGRGRP